MARITIPEFATLELVKDALSNKLGPEYRLRLKRSRLEIVQGQLRGCVVKISEMGHETEIIFGRFIPSTWLGTVVSLACVGGALALALLSVNLIVDFFANVAVGAVFLLMTFLLRLLLSGGTVSEVKKALADMQREANHQVARHFPASRPRFAAGGWLYGQPRLEGACLIVVGIVWSAWTWIALDRIRSGPPDPWAKPVLLIVSVLGVKGAIIIPLLVTIWGMDRLISKRK